MSVRRQLPVLLICCCLTMYFGFHAVHGKHGLEARWGLEVRAHKLAAELRELEAVRAGLEREVALLSDTRPDPAFVEELARGLLGYARPGDRILLPPVRRHAQLR
jgi:cell division protein FtsB